MLSERAVLMRLSISICGEHRQDPKLTANVTAQNGLGASAGKWVKTLYPPDALAPIKKLDNEARTYHASVTLPYDAGIGILPAALIMEHGDRMRDFAGRRKVLVEDFLSQPERWIDWAITEHNGTFNPEEYPGVRKLDPNEVTPQSVEAVLLGRDYILDKAEWRKSMETRFSFSATPLPVPESSHFTTTVSSLLGVDTASVDQRVREAETEAQKELLRRMLEPVAAMATKLSEAPKVRKDGKEAQDIVFRDSLVGNLQDIARLAPALNLGCDLQIDGFITEIEKLTRYSPQALREDKKLRSEAQQKADELSKRMSAYKF